MLLNSSSSSAPSTSSSSVAASEQQRCWEQLLSFRISLQRGLDIGNQLPVLAHLLESNKSDNEEDDIIKNETNNNLTEILTDLHQMLGSQSANNDNDSKSNNKKRKNKNNDEDDITWEKIQATQVNLRDHWESTINKWHARLHFGSEQKKSKMRVFNQTIWEQV